MLLEVVIFLTDDTNKVLKVLIKIDAHSIVEPHSFLSFVLRFLRVPSCACVNRIVPNRLSKFLSINCLKDIQQFLTFHLIHLCRFCLYDCLKLVDDHVRGAGV